jgi:hypothetical protein
MSSLDPSEHLLLVVFFLTLRSDLQDLCCSVNNSSHEPRKKMTILGDATDDQK